MSLHIIKDISFNLYYSKNLIVRNILIINIQISNNY